MSKVPHPVETTVVLFADRVMDAGKAVLELCSQDRSIEAEDVAKLITHHVGGWRERWSNIERAGVNACFAWAALKRAYERGRPADVMSAHSDELVRAMNNLAEAIKTLPRQPSPNPDETPRNEAENAPAPVQSEGPKGEVPLEHYQRN